MWSRERATARLLGGPSARTLGPIQRSAVGSPRALIGRFAGAGFCPVAHALGENIPELLFLRIAELDTGRVIAEIERLALALQVVDGHRFARACPWVTVRRIELVAWPVALVGGRVCNLVALGVIAGVRQAVRLVAGDFFGQGFVRTIRSNIRQPLIHARDDADLVNGEARGRGSHRL